MAYFKVCVRGKRKDNTYPIYIRVTHLRQVGYIKTNKVCKAKFVRNGDITDPYIIKDVYVQIETYLDRLNRVNTEGWNLERVMNFLKNDRDSISFSDFGREFILKMENEGRGRSAKNYLLALKSMESYFGNQNISFSDITSFFLKDWISSMKNSRQKKNAYPNCVKTMFRAGCDKFNDYDTGEMRIRHDPFRVVKIPPKNIADKKALPVDVLRRFFDVDITSLKPSKRGMPPRAYIAKDVSLLVFCLVGINTVDLYNLGKGCYKDGKLCYNRMKTKGRRADEAYIEIEVPDLVKPLFLKYQGRGDRLFNFNEIYASDKTFNDCVNRGIKDIVGLGGLPPVSTYSFRHSWATIAQVVFEAGLDVVGLCLNHASPLRVTAGYVKTDFSIIDRLNIKILRYVFEEKIKKGGNNL